MTDVARREVLAGAAALVGTAIAGQVAAQADRISGGLEYMSALQVADALRARKFSSVEITDYLIARIERRDAAVNAVVVRDFDRARDAAKAADAALARGERRALLGVPMTVKESFNVAGLPTTWGMPQAKDFRPSEDALIVARAKRAGAVLLGKTNVPTMLADAQTYNAIHGVTRNPWNLERTPGGSSGGSSAALAAGFGPLSLGSDAGGSLRVPAHFAGVTALKPSLGLVPGRGHAPPGVPPLPSEPDLAVVGPMARTATDLALLFDVIAEPDELTVGTGYRLALKPPRHERLDRHRVLMLDSHPLMPTATPVRQALDRLSDKLGKSRVRVERSHRQLPDLSEATRNFMRLFMSFAAANWPAALYDQYKGMSAGLADDDNSPYAERLRGISLSHRDWVVADGVRARIQHQWRTLFGEIDVVLCSPMPVPAFAHDHSAPQESRRLEIDGKPYSYIDVGLVWAAPATAAGLPAAVVPIDRGDSPLPIGVQIIGPYLEDRTVLAFAAMVEREYGGFVAPPGYVG